MYREQPSIGKCAKCGQRIMWVRMKSGKNMPVNCILHNFKEESGGKDRIVLANGQVITGRIVTGEIGDGVGYISHFATCEHARTFIKK